MKLTPEELKKRQAEKGYVTAGELLATEFPPDPILVAYDPKVKAITFHERATGDFVYDWDTERLTKRKLVDLFLSLGQKTWSSQRLVADTALVIIRNKLVGES